MIINTFSYLWKATAIDAIAELVDNGYTTFEIPISSPHCWPDEISAAERSATRGKLSEYGADIRSLNAGGYDLNLASPAASMRRKSIDHINSVIDLAAEWDVPEIVISPGTRRPDDLADTRAGARLAVRQPGRSDPAGQAGRGSDSSSNRLPYCFTPTIETLVHVVSTVNDDSLKIVYDVANAAYIGEDPVAACSRITSRSVSCISQTRARTSGATIPLAPESSTGAHSVPAVEATLGVDNVVLEVIREENTLDEFAQALRDLSTRGLESRVDGACAMRALVSGGSSGIGAATSLRLAEAALARGEQAMIAVCGHTSNAWTGGGCRIDPVDRWQGHRIGGRPRRPRGAGQLVAAAVDEFGGLDALVANAGIAKPGALKDLSLEDWDEHVLRQPPRCVASRQSKLSAPER